MPENQLFIHHGALVVHEPQYVAACAKSRITVKQEYVRCFRWSRVWRTNIERLLFRVLQFAVLADAVMFVRVVSYYGLISRVWGAQAQDTAIASAKTLSDTLPILCIAVSPHRASVVA